LAQGGGPETPSTTPNFVKIAQGDSSLRSKFFRKIRNFCHLELLKAALYYTYKVQILLKENAPACESSSTTQNFAKIAQGIDGLPLSHCLGGDAY